MFVPATKKAGDPRFYDRSSIKCNRCFGARYITPLMGKGKVPCPKCNWSYFGFPLQE